MKRERGFWLLGGNRARCVAAIICAFALFAGGCSASKQPPPPAYSWGSCRYDHVAETLRARAESELSKPLVKRSKDAGVCLLDYASACLACGRVQDAQRSLYEAIVLTNDLELDKSGGEASLRSAESLKTWQGEAYERATIELLHGISLMQLGDFDNARVAFNRAIYTDRFSTGAVSGYEGSPAANGAGFQPNEEYSKRGGSVYQRDFLAAYLLRTICYLQDGRVQRARASYDEFQQVYGELRSAAQAAPITGAATTWTGVDGRYAYPSAFLPPFMPTTPNGTFSLSFDELRSANLVVVAAAGCRPRKVKTGQMGYRKGHFVHDAYLPPSEPVHRFDLQLDGRYVGALSQGLNLFGQAAGRGPSAKDLAQQHKANVENFGEVLATHGVYGIQYIGLIVQAANKEEADIRQWGLLPNSIHLWIGHVEPGPHTVSLVATGANIPVREQGWPNVFANVVQQTERNYLTAWSGELCKPGGHPVAPRHTRFQSLTVPEHGLATVFVPEQYNAHVSAVASRDSRSYELQPRRTPEER